MGEKGWMHIYEKHIEDESKQQIKARKFNWEKQLRNLRSTLPKDLENLLKYLPEDSQEYYKKSFEQFIQPDSEKHFKGLSTDDLKKKITEMLVDVVVFILHVSFIVSRDQAENCPEAFEKKFFNKRIILYHMLNAYDQVAVLVFEKSFYDLFKEARGGSIESFFKLLQIDRTVIECEWAKKLIRRSQLTGDAQFFKRMAQAIATSPLENTKVYTRSAIVLLLFWRLGLWKLTSPERRELFIDCGIQVQDPETFRKFEDRLISADLKENIIPINFDSVE
jgi:hypothetical protein